MVDADAIGARFSIAQVNLINDFEAVRWGIAALQSTDLLTLQTGAPQTRGVRLVVGAGTGLGVGWLTCADDKKNPHEYTAHPSEGGHMDFAPNNDTQSELLCYLQQRHGHVSYERLVSGPGLVAFLNFCAIVVVRRLQRSC